MKLSFRAFQSLKSILKKELGDNAKLFSDEEIEKFGMRLLKLTLLVQRN